MPPTARHKPATSSRALCTSELSGVRPGPELPSSNAQPIGSRIVLSRDSCKCYYRRRDGLLCEGQKIRLLTTTIAMLHAINAKTPKGPNRRKAARSQNSKQQSTGGLKGINETNATSTHTMSGYISVWVGVIGEGRRKPVVRYRQQYSQRDQHEAACHVREEQSEGRRQNRRQRTMCHFRSILSAME